MKKILLMLVISIISYSNIQAQQIVNPGFSPGLNNDPQITTCLGSFANGGAIPNWHKTHGTPRFTPSCNGADAAGNFLFMAASANASSFIGEGIAANYEFKAGVKYLIQMSICNTSQFIDASQGLVVSATSVLPQNLPPPGPPTGQCFTAVPGISNVDIESIRVLNAVSPPAIATNNIISVLFTFRPKADRHFIWIFPAIFPGSSVTNCDVTLAQVQIFPECEDLLIFDDGQNGHIPTGKHARFRHIIAGSQGGPNPPVNVTTNPYIRTEFIAQSSVLLKPNFFAIANNRGSFTAFIDELTCMDYVGDEPEVIGGGSGKPGKNHVDKENMSEFSREFSHLSTNINNGVHDKVLSDYYHPKVYPNPSNGSFSIDVPTAGKYQIKIVDMMGAIVYDKIVLGNSQTKINQQNELAHGNYIIRITGEGIKHIEKISIIK